MKELPSSFTRSGWLHDLVQRSKNRAIYSRHKPTSPAPHYEVIRIVTQQPNTVGDIHYEGGECYPSDRQFGKLGWTFPTLEAAQAKYLTLPR